MSKTRTSLHILFLSLFLAATWSPIPAQDRDDDEETLKLTRAIIQVERREISLPIDSGPWVEQSDAEMIGRQFAEGDRASGEWNGGKL